MSVSDPEQLVGFSLAKYSTWVLHRPFGLLFDAGEGVATRLQNSVYGIRQILLSHGHVDHVGGLPTLICSRTGGLGETTTPLTIAHPRGDALVGAMRDYLAASTANLAFELTWQPLEPGDRLPIDELRVAEAFAVRHTPGHLTLGFRVLERRGRLKPELRGLPEALIREQARTLGREAITETYEHPLLVYGGDGLPPDGEHLRGADLAILDGTFASAGDRERRTHATIDEAVAAAAAAGVRTLVLQHASGRYSLDDLRRAATRAVARYGFGGDARLLWRDRLISP